MINQAHDDKHADVSQAERRVELASAKEKVAGPLAHVAAAGWCLVLLLLLLAHWWAWLVAVVAYFGVFFCLKAPYDREYDKAFDAYSRASGTGKYYAGPVKDDAA